MSMIKKYSFVVFIILLFLSILHDLSKEDSTYYIEDDSDMFHIATIKVKTGDTVLSITEEINDIEQLNTEQIIMDFQKLNPGTDYHALRPNAFYYFPLYSEY